ncbi:MAG: biotin/lipoate A/B protein ligase family protein [Candidatus Aerophobetes bacterium]|nr:biotin/lipoate A/B protein ligase family protein [Candidatus Aerophobetes bacterium]
MYLFNLDKLSGQQSMLFFHLLARMGIESLVLVSPKTPLASIGYFQNAEEEVDLEFCKKANIPLMRRELGGGATYLDENQIFHQVIIRRDNPMFSRKISENYKRFSLAVIQTYKKFGIETGFRPINDILTKKGRKIDGEGSGDIGDCFVWVGGILLDFNYEAMSRVLKVPEEKFRDKIYKSMKENLTTMKKELGEIPPREDIKSVLIEKFEKIFGKLKPAELTPRMIKLMENLEKEFTSPAFLFKKTPKILTGVKIREGIEIIYGMHKAKGGLIRAAQEVEKERINEISLSGDFTLYPKDRLEGLEKNLKGKIRKKSLLNSKIEEFYNKERVQTPGVNSEDFLKAMKVEK